MSLKNAQISVELSIMIWFSLKSLSNSLSLTFLNIIFSQTDITQPPGKSTEYFYNTSA
jgi:hypothetical protein